MPLSFMRSIDQLWRRTSEKSLTITQVAHWHIYATLGEMTWDNSKIVLVQLHIQVRQTTDNIKQLHGTSSWFVNVSHTKWNQVPDIAYPYLNANKYLLAKNIRNIPERIPQYWINRSTTEAPEFNLKWYSLQSTFVKSQIKWERSIWKHIIDQRHRHKYWTPA